MALLKVPIALDSLDDNNAIFRGLDEHEINVNPGPFGAMLGHVGTMTAVYPAVCISRDSWEDMGCPTILECRLEVYTPDESSS